MKKLYKLLLICLLILSGGNALKAQDKAYETPTLVNGYYEISKADHLFWFAEYVNTIDRTASAKLMNDIDLEGGYWSTICETALYYNSYSNDYGYSGTFDGNGHVIKNFKVKSSTTADASAGLFGTVCGTIKNLGVENFTFEDGGEDIRAAAIVGQLITTGGKISNCYVKNATITPGEHVTGGIAGCVYDGTIENCYVVNSNINGSSGRYGHIVGDSRGDESSTDRPGTVTNCYSDNTPLISDRKGNLSSVENKSAAQFASGEIAYLLQGEQQTDIWGQNIDNDETKEALPVLGGAKVYKIYNSGCTHYGEFIYSNDANAEFYHEHSFTEDSNGFCTLCNGYEAAELVDGVYHIGNLGQLMWFANNVNTAHKVLLTADITIDNSVVWKPIGLQDGASNSSVFNGDGHTITFDNTNEGSVFGLFGTYNYSIIENLYLAGSITCNTTGNVGALVNSAYRTTIRNVISYVEVTNIGSGRAGGLAGQFGGQHSGELYSLIENCAVYANVTGNVAGGIIGHGWSGYQYYDIKNVAYAGDVTGSERQAAVIAYHGNSSDATKCKFENIYYCEKDALGFVGGGNTNYDLGTDVAAKTTEQFASGEVAHLLQGEQETQVWGQNIDNGETVQQYPVFSNAKVYKHTFNGVTLYSNHENETLTAGGKCGDNLYWHVDENNVLTIFGTGAMDDYEYNSNKSPWRSLGLAPTSLVLEEGVTHIGNNAFYYYYGFEGDLTIPNSVTTIGVGAFYNCHGFKGSLTIPNSVTYIRNNAFKNCRGFTEVYSFAETAPTLEYFAFETNSNATLYYPASGETSYTEKGWFQYFSKSFSFGKCGDNLYWYVDKNNTLTIFGTGAMYDYEYSGDNISPWRELETAPTSLVLEEGITHIGNSAFYQCKGLSGSLTIPNSVTTIGNYAFGNCKGLSGSLTIPNNVTTIGNYAFYCCEGFTGSLTIPNSVTSIGNSAFFYCSGFTGSLTIGNSVTTIGKSAFGLCSGFTGSLTIPNSVTTIENEAFGRCSGFTGFLTIPNSVTTIGEWAFSECSGFTGSLTIPNSVTSIEECTFYGCSGFTGSLTIPNSVTYIGNEAFKQCNGFSDVCSLAETAPTLGKNAFSDINSNAILYYPVSSYQSYDENGWFNYFPYEANGKCGDNLYWYVDDENTLTIFGTGAMYDYEFSGDNISPWKKLETAPTSLVLEEGITHIGNSAFDSCFGFTGSLTIPNSVTSIGNYAFYDCKGFTGDLTIPNSVTTIGNYAFVRCYGFTGSLTIGNSVTSIGEGAFSMCSGFNGSLTIPNSVTNIANAAFMNCSGFNGSLTIPNSVTNIGEGAFYGCSSFTDVYSFAVTAPTLGTGAFDKPNNAILYYPVSSYQSYDENGWFNYFPYEANGKCGDNLYWYVDGNNTLTIFGTGAMYDYDYSGDNISPWRKLETAPTSLVLKEGITRIGNSAFYECSGFTGSLTIPNSVTTIGDWSFYKCSGFNGSLTIGNSVTAIRNSAFSDCSGFTGPLTIPNSVTSIGDYAFLSCYGFTGSLTIGNSVTTIGNFAFDGCSGFNGSLTIPNSVTSIGNYAFFSCYGFTGSLTIGNSVTNIGDYAFYNCYDFTGSLTIPNSVTSIGERAFEWCYSFTEIFFYRDTNPTIGTSVFSDINANAEVCVPVIWESFDNIPSGNLVKMATFVGEQSAVSGQQSGWVFPEGTTEVSADDHVAINAPMVLGRQQDNKTTRQQGSEANSLWVKSFGYCGDGSTINGSITIEDGGQLYCEVARGEVTVKKEILGYQQSESESKWYTIASPLKDTIQITTNSSFLTPNSDLYRYDEPSYTWQNAKNSANNGFNTIDPGRGYLYANAENTTLEFKGDINTETVTYNLTAKSNVLKGFHLVGNPFTHDIYLGEAIKIKTTANIIFELKDSYEDGWNGNALKLSFSDETPDKIITIESGESKTETINVASGVTVTVSFTKGNYPEECSFTIKYDDGEIICDKYSNDGSLTSVVDGETLTTFLIKEGKDVLVNGYYTLTGEGAWAAEASTTEAIKPMQGILVKSLMDDYELKIYNTSRQPSAVSRQRSGKGQQTTDNGQQSLCISVSNTKYSDRAFVVFDKGVGLDKMNHENENIPLLYIPMEDADYAIAMMDINVNEIPVNFETNVMGEYTISLRQENCEFDELYLLDKETDEKVNILEQDYTFIATSSENPERFILMKDAQGSQLEAHSHFAYINNGDIVIYDIEGDADIKIFDALGRCVYQGESSDETTRIANGYSSGVYMIQKVDDNGVKVQKVMID